MKGTLIRKGEQLICEKGLIGETEEDSEILVYIVNKNGTFFLLPQGLIGFIISKSIKTMTLLKYKVEDYGQLSDFKEIKIMKY
jgi:hypothetical protein